MSQGVLVVVVIVFVAVFFGGLSLLVHEIYKDMKMFETLPIAEYLRWRRGDMD